MDVKKDDKTSSGSDRARKVLRRVGEGIQEKGKLDWTFFFRRSCLMTHVMMEGIW